MIYSLDASGQTSGSGQLCPLWGAAADASTKLFIQNLSNNPLHVLVVKSDGSGTIDFLLPGPGDYIDESYVDPTMAVSVQSPFEGHAYTALRIA